MLRLSDGWCGRGFFGALFVLSALSLAPRVTLADDANAPAVLLLTPTPGEDAASWAAIVRALRTLGKRAVQVSDLPIDPVFAACRASACARKAARAAGLPAALYNLESSLAGDPELTLRVFGPEDTQVALRTERAGLTVEQSAMMLFERAQRQLSLGAAALLQVSSVPVGALIEIDGESAGVGPIERTLRQGPHVVRVSAEGFTPQERRFELEGGRVLNLEVRLPRAPRADALAVAEGANAPSARAVSPWNFILGGALIVASLPLLISSVNALSNDGQCLDSVTDICTQRATFGPRSGVLLGAGAVALLGGGYLMLARPFSVSVEAAPTGAALRLRLRLRL